MSLKPQMETYTDPAVLEEAGGAAVSQKGQGDAENGGRTEKEVESFAAIAAAPSGVPSRGFLPSTEPQAPKNRRGRPKKVADILKKGLVAEGRNVKISVNSIPQQHMGTEEALKNGNPVGQLLKGIGRQQQRLISCSTDKHSDPSASCASAREEPAAERQEMLFIQENCPPSKTVCHIRMSDIDTPYHLKAGERINKDSCPVTEERSVVPLMLGVSQTHTLLPQGLNYPLATLNKRVEKEKQDIRTANSLPSTGSSLTTVPPTCEQVDSATVGELGNQQDSQLVSSGRNVVKEMIGVKCQPCKRNCCDSDRPLFEPDCVRISQTIDKDRNKQIDGGTLCEPEVKIRRKVGRPPKNKRTTKNQLAQNADRFQGLESGKSENCTQDISVGETVAVDRTKKKEKIRDVVSLNAIKMKSALKQKTSTNHSKTPNPDVAEIRSPSTLQTEFPTLISTSVRQKKKVGRPKKRVNTINETLDAVSHITASFKQPAKSPRPLTGRRSLDEAGVCAEKQKRIGRGHQAESSLSQVTAERQPVKKLCEKNSAHKINKTRKPGEMEGKGKMGSARVSCGFHDGTTSNPNGPLSQKQQKCGHQKNMPAESEKGKTVQALSPSPKNILEQAGRVTVKQDSIAHLEKLKHRKQLFSQVFSDKQRKSTGMRVTDSAENLVVSQDILQVLNKSTGSDTPRNTPETLNAVEEERVELGEQGGMGEVLVGLKGSNSSLKLKRKIGRPFKKKTLIKMAKQMVLAQQGRVNAKETDLIAHPETGNVSQDITSHYPRISKLKKEKKNDLWLQDTHVRRYTRACKSSADDKVTKQGVHSKSSKAVLSPSSGAPDPLLQSEKTFNAPVIHSPKPELDVCSSKGGSLKPPKKKRKIKVEESQQPVWSGCSKMPNLYVFQKVPGFSQETLTGCDSVFSFGDAPTKGWEAQKKPRKMEHKRLKGINTISQNTVIPNKLLVKPEYKADAVGKDMSSDPESAGSILEMKNPYEVKAGMRHNDEGVSMLDSAVRNASNSLCDTPRYLPPPPRDVSVSVGAPSSKMPRKRGRPRKTVPIQDLKTEVDPMYSVEDQKRSVSEACQSKLLEAVSPPLNVSSEIETKKAHKVDRRKKRFRNQKALLGVRETVVKTSKADAQLQMQEYVVGQCEERKLEAVALKNFSEEFGSPGNAWPVKSLCITDTGRMASVQQPVEVSGTNQFTKWQKKGTGSRKRRRRKRSWWDDRGKVKVEPLEKKLESAPDVSLQSSENQAEVGTVKTAKYDRTAAEQLDESQKAAKVTTQSQLLTRESESGQEISAAESSDMRKLLKTVSSDEKGSEDHGTSGKPLTNDLKTDNQVQVCYSEKDSGLSLEVMDSENTVKSCRKAAGKGSGDENLKEKVFSDSKDEDGKLKSVAANTAELEMEALKEVAEDFGKKPEVLKKGQMQSPVKERQQRDALILISEQKVQGDPFALDPSKSESEVACEADKNSPEAVVISNILPPVLPDSSNERVKAKDQFSQLCSEQLQNKNSRKEIFQSVEQSVQEAERSSTDQNCAKSTSEVPVASESSKPRGPGRPPRCQEKKPIECSYCGRTFHHISSYIIHRRVHTGERPYSCQECGKTFAQRSNLNTHRKVHRQAELLQCPYCSSRFSDRDKLLEHCRTHNLEPDLSTFTEKFGNNKTVDVDVHPKNSSAESSIALKDAKPHVCEVCGKGFRFCSMLKIHMRVHSGEKPYSCKVCGKSFSQACSVRVHEKIHWSVKPYVCTVCGKGFAQLGTLKAHLCTHIGDDQVQEAEQKAKSPITFQCHICKKSFGLRHQYNLHIRNHGDFQTYTCDVCGQKYTQMSDLNVHRQTCLKYSGDGTSSAETATRPVQASRESQRSQTQDDKHFPPQSLPYLKSQSDQKFQSRAPQQPHNQGSRQTEHGVLKQFAHLQTQSFKPLHMFTYSNHVHSSALQPCKMSFKNPQQRYPPRRCLFQSLREHRKSDPRKYLCPRCGRLFRHLGRLRAHMLTHVRGLSYTCGQCGKTLENWNKFWLHQRVHRQKRGRFFCSECGQGFRFAGLYRKHLLEHAEKKPHVCHLCPYTCSCEEILKDHQREWHGSSKPYTCNICQKGFFHQKNLERHLFVHHRVHTRYCPLCNVSFLHPGELQLHLETHVNVSFPLREASSQPLLLPYQCGACDASFKTVNLLFQHQLCHSSPSNTAAWQSGHVVDQVSLTFPPQKVQQHFKHKHLPNPGPYFQPEVSSANIPESRSHYFSHYQNKCSVDAASSTSAPIISRCNRSSVDGQDSCPGYTSLLPHPHPSPFCPSFSQHGGNEVGRPATPPTPRSATDRLPQTLSSSAAVPFSKPRSPHLPNQSGTLIQLSAGALSANEEELEEGFQCAECGEQFTDVPELYEHYLQHARGEV